MQIHDSESMPIRPDGKYVAYVNPSVAVEHAVTIFLISVNNTWIYPGSPERYREHVYQWIGPLPSLELED